MFIWIICFIISSLALKSPIGGVVNQDIIRILLFKGVSIGSRPSRQDDNPFFRGSLDGGYEQQKAF